MHILFNRELSLIEFHERVLLLSQDPDIPLLNRLRLLLITSRNLDEFFEVRVSVIKQRIAFNEHSKGLDGLSAGEALHKIYEKTHELVANMYHILHKELIPALAKEHILLVAEKEWTKNERLWAKNYFNNEVLPIISPIAIDMAHPFPNLANKSLNFIVKLEGKDAFKRRGELAIIHVPRSIPRVVQVPNNDSSRQSYCLLIFIIKAFAGALFPGMKVKGCYQFRITRNSDLALEKEEIDDLAIALRSSLLSRHFGNAVRLEVTHDCPDEIADYLLMKHNLKQEEMYRIEGPVNLSRYMMMLNLIQRPDLTFKPFNPSIPTILQKKSDVFAAIRKQDILLHYPFQSFESFLELIRQAKNDPQVVAIKQTLYRTGVESKTVKALIDAARAGIEVTAVIELRARFDEASNLALANSLQEAGALVVYGIVGYKTHAKMCLIVRREEGKLKRYVHLGTGNYHAKTAKEYTDYGLLTYDQDIGHDVHQIFQQLTGICKKVETKKLLYSPFSLHKTLLALINKEKEQAKKGKPARIIAKMNGLTDATIIQVLYDASNAGVKIDLIVRGICCLRPKLKNYSENIRVISTVGRFLEHSRVFYFYQGGKERLYLSSADWMERNFYHRIETCFPIDDKDIINRILQDLNVYLMDNSSAWELQADGHYKKRTPGKKRKVNAQWDLLQSMGSD